MSLNCNHNGPILYPSDDMTREPRWKGTDRKNSKNSEKFCPSATLCITNLIWTKLGANLVLRGERSVTNSLSHSTARSLC